MTLLVVFVCTLIYLLGFGLTVPLAYHQFRDRVRNAEYRDPPNTSARNYSWLVGILWPVSWVLVVAWLGMLKADRQAEMDKQERAELECFRAAALKEIEEL